MTQTDTAQAIRDHQVEAHAAMDAGCEDHAWIETVTGKRFFFLRPTPDQIVLADVAHALSMQCRYAGHTQRFYSVAEHCVLLADWIFKQYEDPELALEALLHDASEAYLVDICRPIKPHLGGYYSIEQRIQAAVAVKWGIRPGMDSRVKDADARILVDERAQAMRPSGNVWASDELLPLQVELRFWSPSEARDNFLFAFEEYQSLSIVKRANRARID